MRSGTEKITACICVLLGSFLSDSLSAEDDLGAIASEEVELSHRKRTKKAAPARTYFFIGPKRGHRAPPKGYGLLLVLPGGSGNRDFHAFVKRIYQNALGGDWVAAQLIATPWAGSKQIVWPTRQNAPQGLGLETEDFVEDVVTDVARRLQLDPSRIFLLAWSSSGPAAYAISLQPGKSVTGFYIAMSVFKPNQLPPLAEARSDAYFLLHSPEDEVCPHRLALEAETRLRAAGAKVRLETYAGGHGWRGDVFGNLREGLSWLQENRAPPEKKMWPASRLRPPSRRPE